jgi:hypothetical protein
LKPSGCCKTVANDVANTQQQQQQLLMCTFNARRTHPRWLNAVCTVQTRYTTTILLSKSAINVNIINTNVKLIESVDALTTIGNTLHAASQQRCPNCCSFSCCF